jgi:DNA-binding response OmpR family regulator
MLSGKTVLFVDDEDGIRQLGECVFAAAGCEAHIAANGKEAIRAMETRTFDLAVIDIMMPDRDGIETIREFKARWPECKLIAISGMENAYLLNLALMIGADVALSKPFALAEIIGAGEAVTSFAGPGSANPCGLVQGRLPAIQ